MKKIFYKAILIIVLALGACTDNFEEINTQPYQIDGESLQQDFNNVGAFYPDMLYNLFGHQVEHNLVHDSFIRHLATPTPFVGGVNNTTYYLRWNTFWDRIYSNVMATGRQVIKLAEEDDYDVFAAWARLIMITGTSRLTAYHGPLIYSDYGSSNQIIEYDSEEVLYTTWFRELDEILAVFEANKDYTGMTTFDATYGGDVTKWIKFTNSLRLRLAMRLVNIKPELAQTQGEKALKDAGGLIIANADNMYISLYGNTFNPATICFSWNDTRMSATMESVLVGYKDKRIEKYFEPVTNVSLVADHVDWPYKGIRNGAYLVAKDDHTNFSTINKNFKSVNRRRLFAACETHFLVAEAALRGWGNTGEVKTNYENAIRTSFVEWGADGVDEYLNDSTSLPLDYNDPVYDGDINDFTNRIMVTVKWDDAAINEVKLEKIMTQKWISGYMNTVETWVDHRRTDYPKLPFNYQNDSSSDWGIIANDDFLRRMTFVDGERNNNPLGVADASTKLGGSDEIGTRLWWDVPGSNF